MREPLYNQRFGDIYFSAEDGLAETRHVFLDGNDLPARWRDCRRFTIAETGFGSGLNFLAAWALFEQTAPAEAVLDYVSAELYPLTAAQIGEALAHWRGEFGARLDRLLELYPLRIAGFHRIRVSPQVRLTLIIGDVNEVLPQVEAPMGVDAWFLDGFAPAKNPQMWGEVLFREMKRLSRPRTTAATFTAAGAVRRGLAGAGFAVEKKPGFGRKRDMTVARFDGDSSISGDVAMPKRVAIIGGGLAGTACAHVLRENNVAVTLYEASSQLAAGASGNSLGLYNPKFTAQRGAEAEFYSSAFALAVRTFSQLTQTHEIAFGRCGAVHLANTPEKEKRFRTLLNTWGWESDHLRYLSATEASSVCGLTVANDALYLPDSGFVSPVALCRAYAAGADIRLGAPVLPVQTDDGWRVGAAAYDAVIMASAVAVKDMSMLSWLPLHTVRGQISAVRSQGMLSSLRTNLCYGGYIAPSRDGFHVLGSTFQKWLTDCDVREEDHAANRDKLRAAVPALAGTAIDVTGGRAALRTVSPDHMPVIGAACDGNGRTIPELYVSTAHGSHGVLSSLAGAQLIADLMLATPRSLPAAGIAAVSAGRATLAGKD